MGGAVNCVRLPDFGLGMSVFVQALVRIRAVGIRFRTVTCPISDTPNVACPFKNHVKSIQLQSGKTFSVRLGAV
jgi:hypothetical protein